MSPEQRIELKNPLHIGADFCYDKEYMNEQSFSNFPQGKSLLNKEIDVIKKQDLYNKTLKELDRIVDLLEHPIEPNIKETVAALNVNGFPTNMSCEGHVEERFGKLMKLSPYVGIGVEEPKIRFVGEVEIKNNIASQFGISVDEISDHKVADDAYWDYIQKNEPPETTEYISCIKKNSELKENLSIVLESFYNNRQVKEETQLVLEDIDPCGSFSINPKKENPEHIELEDIDKYRKELSEEQKEIIEFGIFLKNRFFDHQ